MEKKSLGVAYFAWFFGGFHYVYLGRPMMTFLMWLAVALGGIGAIWWLVDAFRLPGMVESCNRGLAQEERDRKRQEALETATLSVLEKLAQEGKQS